MSYEPLVILDHDYVMADQILDSYLDKLIASASTFVQLCKDVATFGIEESEMLTGLARLQSEMEWVHGRLSELRTGLHGSSGNGQGRDFIRRVNEIDRFLY